MGHDCLGFAHEWGVELFKPLLLVKLLDGDLEYDDIQELNSNTNHAYLFLTVNIAPSCVCCLKYMWYVNC